MVELLQETGSGTGRQRWRPPGSKAQVPPEFPMKKLFYRSGHWYQRKPYPDAGDAALNELIQVAAVTAAGQQVASFAIYICVLAAAQGPLRPCGCHDCKVIEVYFEQCGRCSFTSGRVNLNLIELLTLPDCRVLCLTTSSRDNLTLIELLTLPEGLIGRERLVYKKRNSTT